MARERPQRQLRLPLKEKRPKRVGGRRRSGDQIEFRLDEEPRKRTRRSIDRMLDGVKSNIKRGEIRRRFTDTMMGSREDQRSGRENRKRKERRNKE